MSPRRDPHSWHVVRLPERDLPDVISELAAPLLERLGPTPSFEQARAAIDLVVRFWNASVLASKNWGPSRPKDLRALERQMRGRQAPRDDAAAFDIIVERRREHWLDPRLVESWTYEADAAGARRLLCAVGLPDGVRAEIPPPAEKRVAIGGKFLDEVKIPLGANSYLSFPIARHRGVLGQDGTVTVRTMMPAALQLFAEGRLPPIGKGAVDVVLGGRDLGSMVLVAVQGDSADLRQEVTILVFKPAKSSSGAQRASRL